MDFELTVNMLLPLVTGQSARGEWKKQEVIFELPGEFNRKLCVGFWNDRAVDAAALRPGDRVALSVNVESREYNGRWYTEVRAWRMSRLDVVQQPAGGATASEGYGAGQPQPVSQPAQAVVQQPAAGATSADEVDDLPF